MSTFSESDIREAFQVSCAPPLPYPLAAAAAAAGLVVGKGEGEGGRCHVLDGGGIVVGGGVVAVVFEWGDLGRGMGSAGEGRKRKEAAGGGW